MTPQQWSNIQRQLGFIEEMAMSVGGIIGDAIADGLVALSEMLEPLAPHSAGKEGAE